MVTDCDAIDKPVADEVVGNPFDTKTATEGRKSEDTNAPKKRRVQEEERPRSIETQRCTTVCSCQVCEAARRLKKVQLATGVNSLVKRLGMLQEDQESYGYYRDRLRELEDGKVDLKRLMQKVDCEMLAINMNLSVRKHQQYLMTSQVSKEIELLKMSKFAAHPDCCIVTHDV